MFVVQILCIFIGLFVVRIFFWILVLYQIHLQYCKYVLLVTCFPVSLMVFLKAEVFNLVEVHFRILFCSLCCWYPEKLYCFQGQKPQALCFSLEVYGLSFCAGATSLAFIMINVVRWSQTYFFPCGYSIRFFQENGLLKKIIIMKLLLPLC